MGRLSTLGVLALLVATQALPTPTPECHAGHFSPYQQEYPQEYWTQQQQYYPQPDYQLDVLQQGGQTNMGCLAEEISMLPPYYGARLIPIGDGNVQVSVPDNPATNQLLSMDFHPISRVPGGVIYIKESPQIQLQIPPIGISLPTPPPIQPEPLIIQPQPQPPINLPPITIRPQPLPPIYPPPMEVLPPQQPPIYPQPIIVRPPRPEPIQPEPISVRPNPMPPITPPPIVVRQPTLPTIQPPPIVIPCNAFEQVPPCSRPCFNPNPYVY